MRQVWWWKTLDMTWLHFFTPCDLSFKPYRWTASRTGCRNTGFENRLFLLMTMYQATHTIENRKHFMPWAFSILCNMTNRQISSLYMIPIYAKMPLKRLCYAHLRLILPSLHQLRSKSNKSSVFFNLPIHIHIISGRTSVPSLPNHCRNQMVSYHPRFLSLSAILLSLQSVISLG